MGLLGFLGKNKPQKLEGKTFICYDSLVKTNSNIYVGTIHKLNTFNGSNNKIALNVQTRSLILYYNKTSQKFEITEIMNGFLSPSNKPHTIKTKLYEGSFENSLLEFNKLAESKNYTKGIEYLSCEHKPPKISDSCYYTKNKI